MDESIIVETIKKMKESGLEDDIIISTLEDVGISRDRAVALMAKASGQNEAVAKGEVQPKAEAQEKAESPEMPEETKPGEEAQEEAIEVPQPEIAYEEVPESPIDEIKARLEETKLEHDLQHTTMQAALVQQTSMLEDLHKSVQGVASQKPECPKTMSEQIVKIQADIEKIKMDLADAKADIAAMKELMSKVLDSTKKVLLRLS